MSEETLVNQLASRLVGGKHTGRPIVPIVPIVQCAGPDAKWMPGSTQVHPGDQLPFTAGRLTH